MKKVLCPNLCMRPVLEKVEQHTRILSEGGEWHWINRELCRPGENSAERCLQSGVPCILRMCAGEVATGA